MTKKEVLKELEQYGDERTKNIFLKHGAKEPFFGVRIHDMKKILKKTKKNHELSLELYKTGNSDAMYLAGLMADENQITKGQLEDWADKAYWSYLSEYTVPWVAAETEYGFYLGMKWIESDEERFATAGWSTLAYYAAVNEDEVLDIDTYSNLLDRAGEEIHNAQNRVRYTMNGFVIAVGTYIKDLTDKSKKVAENMGTVTVDMGGTTCKVPLASEYIQKVVDKGRIGTKRKTVRC